MGKDWTAKVAAMYLVRPESICPAGMNMKPTCDPA